MALSDEQIEQGQQYLKVWQKYTSRPMAAHHLSFARDIEAEVRNQDAALILMLVERLERADKISGHANNKASIKAGRAWLEGFDNAIRRTRSAP